MIQLNSLGQDELAAAGLRGMSIRLGNSYASEGLEEARTVHQELLGSLSKTGIGRLRIYEPAGEDWACAASASPAPSITSLWFSCSRGDPDVGLLPLSSNAEGRD